MDVLLDDGSIDVHGLLSVSPEDATAQLSSPDLRLIIDRLNYRAASLKSGALTYMLSHSEQFSSFFSLAATASSSSSSLLSSSLTSVFPDPSRLISLCDDLRHANVKLKECRYSLNAVSAISSFISHLRSTRNILHAGLLLEASHSARQLKALLPQAEDEEPVVYDLLRKEFAELLNEVQEVLVRKVEHYVEFDPMKKWVFVKSAGEPDLCNVLQALEIIDGLHYGMAKVADLMIKHAIGPAIIATNFTVSVETLNAVGSEESGVVLRLVSSGEPQVSGDGHSLYSTVIEIIKYVQKFICMENVSRLQCFGKLSWPRVADLIVTHFLSKAVPDIAARLVDFQDIMTSTYEFENNLKQLSYISSDQKDKKLSRYVSDVEVHFASKKRNEILAKARNIVRHYEYVQPPASVADRGSCDHVVDTLVLPDKCFISKTVSQLMALVHDTLKVASLSSARVAKEFYNAVRDVLLLYKAVMPVLLEKKMGSINQTAAILHDDFLYLSQEILGLAFQYRVDFPTGLQKHFVFVDMAPHFHRMAEDILDNQIQLAISNLVEAIRGADGFHDTDQPKQYELAKFSIEQVVFILEKIHIMWEPILPTSVYRRSMFTLLDFVFSRVTQDMLLLDDIGANETLQLQGIIHLALENVSTLFSSLSSNETGKDKVLSRDGWDLYENVPSLKKFHKLADLFDMPLKLIMAALESGELSDCGFTNSEVESFIKAIFADSPLRRECLSKIGKL